MLFFLLLISRHENHFDNPLGASKAQLKVKLIIFLFPVFFLLVFIITDSFFVVVVVYVFLLRIAFVVSKM